ncbi:hypothetical protein GOB98_10530 [Sinorhizobium meliloti]|nr:hypothetical protein [Sinorhizobium meliloti]MDW9976525.1 hypothetical protein [Sinorhizobium meliloti]MDX0293247.1 hypothetical protein [Sinorhizobium meliloti]
MKATLALNRRQVLTGAVATAATLRISGKLHSEDLCAKYVDGVIQTCDDARVPGSETGPGLSTSPTPWHTWNDDALRQWDADLLRWQNVRAETAAKVSNLIDTLQASGDGRAMTFAELQESLDRVLTRLAGEYTPAPVPSSPDEAEFWNAIGDAKNGAEKILAVNRSLVRASASGRTAGHLSEFINTNGLAKGTAFQDVVSVLPANIQDLRRSTLIADTNFLLLADTALRDLKAAGNVPTQPYNTALEHNRANIASSLVMVAATQQSPVTLSHLEASASASGPLAYFLKGVTWGILNSAADTVNAIATVITHPVESARAIAMALSNSPAILDALQHVMQDAEKTIRTGSAEDRGNLLGRLGFEIVAAIAGGAVTNRIVSSAELGSNVLRRLTDQFVILDYASKARAALPSIPSELKFISSYLSDGVEVFWNYQYSTDSILDYIRAAEIQFDELMQVKFLPDGTLSPAGRLLAEVWSDIISDTDAIIAELAATIDMQAGTVMGLSNAKALVDRIWAMSESVVPFEAKHFADTRYSKAFEQSLRSRLGGREAVMGNRQIDIVTDQYIIQASVNDFRRTPNAIDSFMNGPKSKRAQVEATRQLATENGLKAAYYFRRKPPEAIETFLRDLGMDDVWWDLE